MKESPSCVHVFSCLWTFILSAQDCSEEVDFVPVFGTEVLEDSNPRWLKEGEVKENINIYK